MKKDKVELQRAVESLNRVRSELILYSARYEYISEEKYNILVNALDDLLEETKHD